MNKDWEIKKLYEVCEIECGTRVVRKVDGGTIYPVYGGGGATFKMDTYNREDCLIVSRFAMSEKCTRFVEGKFFLNDSGLSLKANENVIYQKYLETVILGKNDEIYSLGRGAAQKNLDMARFRELEISYPKSLEEQKRIVKILDEKFAQLETIKTNAQTNLQNAKDLFQSQLAKAFSNTTWEKKRLEETVVPECTLGYGIVQPGDDVANGVPVVRPVDLTTKYIVRKGLKKVLPKISQAYSRTILKGGELLICVRGTTGVVSVASEELKDCNVTRGISPLRFNDEITTLFMYYCFQTKTVADKVQEKTKGTALKQINIGDLRNIQVPVPPLPEQKRIVKELDTLSEKVRQLQEIYTKQIANCDELKQSLLQKAFEGEL